MLNQQILRIFLIVPAFALASCVTVNLGPGKPKPAEGVSYSQPGNPFEEIKLKDSDHAWQSKKTGNTISYLSTCNDPTDPPLETARNEYLNSLSGLKVLSENNSTYNDREALTTVADGAVDGIKTRLELLLFKKNNCLYSLSYVAETDRFNEGIDAFHNFVQSFKAP